MKNLIISKTKEGRKENMKKKVTVILCSLLMILLVGCGGNASNSIIGQWVNIDENDGDSFEFFSDGTGIIIDSDGTTHSVTWIAENERIKITVDMGILGEWSSSCDYKLDKDSLTIDDGEGNIDTYTKVK